MSVINTNYLALVSQNNLTKSQNSLGTAIERLSSGLRINSAKDDAAGQAIANRFTANINGLTQAARNANDGISIAQTTEGSLNEINENLQRIRTLTVQATTGSNSDTDLQSIQNEINERMDEINRISKETQFNGKYVLGDDGGSLSVQVGAHDNQQITINLSRIDSSTLNLKGFNVDGSGRIANTAATAANLPAGTTDNGDGTHTVTTDHTALNAMDALGYVENGNTVKVTTAAGTTDYTYDAAAGNFTFSDSATAAGNDAAGLTGLANDIAGRIGNDTSFSVTFGATQTNVKVGADGSLTAENGDKLFIEGSQLTAAPNGAGTYTQAKLEDVVKLAAETADAKIEHNGVTYTTSTAHNDGVAAGQITISGSTISKTDLAALMSGGTATANTEISVGNSVVGGTITVDKDGKSTDAYKDAAGSLTNQANSTATYTVTEDGLTLDGKAVYVNDSGSLTTEADRAGTRTEDPLKALDSALQQVDDLRSHLGAIQNRFQSTIANLNNTVNNLSAARSRIEDADYAVEVSNMTRAQILQQAGTSVLAQANQVPQTVLSLLR